MHYVRQAHQAWRLLRCIMWHVDSRSSSLALRCSLGSSKTGMSSHSVPPASRLPSLQRWRTRDAANFFVRKRKVGCVVKFTHYTQSFDRRLIVISLRPCCMPRNAVGTIRYVFCPDSDRPSESINKYPRFSARPMHRPSPARIWPRSMQGCGRMRLSSRGG
jgi:hypothetical protein